MVLVMDEPLIPMDTTKPNMKNKNRKLKVRLRSTVEMPMSTRPARITFLPLDRSNIWPLKGWVRPLTRNPVPTATDNVNRLHPNSSSRGIMEIPKLCLAPVLTKARNIVVATMYQP